VAVSKLSPTLRSNAEDDRSRKRIILRQFHVEGFVNQYVQAAPSADGRLVFVTESIENIQPARGHARLTNS
jgi:hypothetical protein